MAVFAVSVEMGGTEHYANWPIAEIAGPAISV
jgi:hypothetical protein